MLKKIIIAGVLFLFIVGVAVVVYGWRLSVHVEERFASRRWSIPSKVFSDTTLLYPGQQISRQLFHKKLIRLGYREVHRQPERKGEVYLRQKNIQIFLNYLETPLRKRPGFLVNIEIRAGTIESIIKMDNNETLALLELEPEEITQFFGQERERRQLVDIRQVPEDFIHAVLAAEDGRFFEHWGIDPRGILRAFITNLRHGSIRQGGSTITQQLAKNYFLTPERTISRKLKELLLSVVLEIKYSKTEILEIYLNEIYLGQKGSVSINGIGEASYFYFGKSVQEISLSEAAVIAGLIKAPNHYSPYVDKKACRIRRDDVLNTMHRRGWINDVQLKEQKKLEIKTVGYTQYGKKAPYFVDYLAQQLTSLYRPEDLASLGLSIFTTLDTQVQMAAEEALATGLYRLEQKIPTLKHVKPDNKLQGAVLVMQPKTGHILAMIGGRSYSESQFNRITQARRQPGSAFKPFVYAAGLDEFTPISILSNQPKKYTVGDKTWEPKNFIPDMKDQVSFRKALEKSYNLATVYLAMQIGLDSVIETSKRFGFSTPLKPYPSLALGAFEVIPLELARAYCVFAADGILPSPLALKTVVDENGNILEQRYLKMEELISPAKAFIVTSLLQGVVDRGTARKLKDMGISFPAAGKTGTSNNFRDSWFVGYTPDILALIWVGFDNGDPINASGSAAALPIWADLMNAIPSYISGKAFRVPDGVEKRTICVDDDGMIDRSRCSDTIEEYFLAENVPEGLPQPKQGVRIFNKIIDRIKDVFGGK